MPVIVQLFGGGLQREACLANAARPQQCEQAHIFVIQQRNDFAKFMFAPDERRWLRR
jgi:hypothetical protein